MLNFGQIFTDPLSGAVMITGLVAAAFARGFAGFGSAPLLVASWSLVTDPLRAVALALGFEILASLIQLRGVWRHVPWRTVLFILAIAGLSMPAGVLILAVAPKEVLRLGIAVFVLGMSLVLFLGVRLPENPGRVQCAGIGAVSGIVNGATGMGGLPVALFFTASFTDPAKIRAAMIIYLMLVNLMTLALLQSQNLMVEQTFTDIVIAAPIMIAGLWLGARRFRSADPHNFRRFVLVMLAVISGIGIVRAGFALAI